MCSFYNEALNKFLLGHKFKNALCTETMKKWKMLSTDLVCGVSYTSIHNYKKPKKRFGQLLFQFGGFLIFHGIERPLSKGRNHLNHYVPAMSYASAYWCFLNISFFLENLSRKLKCYMDEHNVCSVTSKPSQSSSRRVLSFKDSSALLNNWEVELTKVKSF